MSIELLTSDVNKSELKGDTRFLPLHPIQEAWVELA